LDSADSTVGSKEASREKSFRRRSETSRSTSGSLFIAEVSDPNYELFKKNLHKLREEGIDSLREAIRNPDSELRRLRRAQN